MPLSQIASNKKFAADAVREASLDVRDALHRRRALNVSGLVHSGVNISEAVTQLFDALQCTDTLIAARTLPNPADRPSITNVICDTDADAQLALSRVDRLSMIDT
eukprot:GHVN01013213.1.p2 GENE.GHVN01013213.1~~GHVN01013213.1.p2  ORF type:complete len:105 (+),score=17.54 GHVN01013213.1:204-518(+)